MKRCTLTLVLLVAVTAMSAGPLHAQGVLTGTLTGTVISEGGAPLPDVMVTATSPALQGERVGASDVNGRYSLRGLPVGTYTLSFVLGTLDARREAIVVNSGGTADVIVTLSPPGLSESVTVTASAPRSLTPTVVSQTLKKQQMDALPVGRRPVDVAELSAGLTTNTYNAGQLAIAGAFGYDNVFMVDGVDTNDTIIGSSNNLFIEDAIEETTVLAHGIPAAYGRFSGGVVNVVTRSGGNTFSGSIRENFSNPKWIGQTPREKANNITHRDVLNKAHEGTFGGPLLRNRIWFFTAGRYEQLNTPNTFAQTGGAYTRTDTNKRGEIKLTGRIGSDALQVTYIGDSTTQAQASAIAATRLVDARTLLTRRLPNRLFAANYNTTIGSRLLATAQYSQKTQRFVNNGGTSLSITDSPFQTLGATAGVPGGLFYHAPYLDANDPEQRNNRQITGSVSSLFASPKFGSHDLKAGGEHFIARGIGGNSQSSTGYVFVTDYVVRNGVPVLDANGSPIPVFMPGASMTWNFLAARGSKLDMKTSSVYAQDRWAINQHVTVDLGTRVEMVHGSATGDISTVSGAAIMPRLGAAYDLKGDGVTVLTATYSHYSGKYGQVQFGANTNVGRPSEVDRVYTGPAGQGSDFAPGFDVNNYTRVVFASFPTGNVRMDEDLRSPIVREFTAGVSRELGRNGYAKATYAARTTSHFVEDFLTRDTGTTNVASVGVLTNRVYGNSDVPKREYRALILETSYRPLENATVGGHYTMQIRNHGNFVGEAAGQPGISSPFGDFPEVLGPALDRLMPMGALDQFQRHKLRVFGIYTQKLGPLGSATVSPIWRVNSGTAYSLTAAQALTAVELARNPGYPTNDINSAVRQTIFFGERGEYRFKGYGVMDLAATYSIPVWKSAQPWVKFEVYNALNNQKLIAWDKTVTVDRASVLDANGLPTGYIKGPRFGQATADNQYPQPYPGQNGSRAFRMAAGLRF